MRKKKLTRQDAIYQIALAGICSAVALLLVWLSVLVRFSTIAFYVAAGLVLMVPLSQKYYLSSFFAYAVSAVLGFVIAGDIIVVVGYVAYFGPMALLTGILCNKKVKWWISLIIKIIFINGMLALLYFVCHTIVIDESIMEKISYWVIALVGTVALVLIDYVVQFAYARIGHVVGKALRKKTDDKQQEEVIINDDEQDDNEVPEHPFDEMDE